MYWLIISIIYEQTFEFLKLYHKKMSYKIHVKFCDAMFLILLNVIRWYISKQQKIWINF